MKPTKTVDVYASRRKTFDQSFWPKVNKTESCWLWTGALLQSGGYGSWRDPTKGKSVRAHRALWERIHGPIPDGMFLCHKCDVPACVNPDHMFLGTAGDNNFDSHRKGRKPHGEHMSTARLTDAKVRQARSMRLEGATYDAIATATGVATMTVWLAINRKTWKHVV